MATSTRSIREAIVPVFGLIGVLNLCRVRAVAFPGGAGAAKRGPSLHVSPTWAARCTPSVVASQGAE